MILTVLVTLLVTMIVKTSTADECTLCPGNATPTNGHVILLHDKELGNITCNMAVAFVSVLNDTECFTFQELGESCGCTTVDEIGIAAPDGSTFCSGLCSNGQPPPNPNTTWFGGVSCGDYNDYLKLVSNETQCTEIQQSIGSFCGCAGFESNTTCLGVCSNGQPPPNGNTTFVFDTSCEDWDINIQFVSDKTQCAEIQQSIGSYCGCADTVPTCSGVCSDGQPPQNGNISPLQDILCQQYDDYLKFVTNETQCTEIQQSIGSFCGCPGIVPICSGVCQNGKPPPNGNLTYFYNTSCEEWDVYLQFVSDETQCAEIQQSIGLSCGCDGNIPSCSGVCSNGQFPPNTNATLPDGFSCGQYDDYLRYVANETQCAELQHEIGSFCGCNSTPTLDYPVATVTSAPIMNITNSVAIPFSPVPMASPTLYPIAVITSAPIPAVTHVPVTKITPTPITTATFMPFSKGTSVSIIVRTLSPVATTTTTTVPLHLPVTRGPVTEVTPVLTIVPSHVARVTSAPLKAGSTPLPVTTTLAPVSTEQTSPPAIKLDSTLSPSFFVVTARPTASLLDTSVPTTTTFPGLLPTASPLTTVTAGVLTSPPQFFASHMVTSIPTTAGKIVSKPLNVSSGTLLTYWGVSVVLPCLALCF